MRANVKELKNGEWIVVEVSTGSPAAKFWAENIGSGREALAWARSLPTLLEGKEPVRFTEDPEAWLRKLATVRYSRLAVELVS